MCVCVCILLTVEGDVAHKDVLWWAESMQVYIQAKPADYTDLVFVVFGNEIQQRTWFCSRPVIQTA